MVSPATLNDAWITNGMSRYAELMYLEDSAGKVAMQSAITDVEAGALAYDTDPLTTLGRLDPFSPQFQSETLEKGAMVFHMLRWEMGDDTFAKFLQTTLTQFTDKPIRTSQLHTVAEDTSKLQLTAFFSQWLDGTGAPEFGDNYTVFRLGSNKGFRTVGAVTQDLDLFSMPVQLRIETEGKTEDRRVDLAGTESTFTIETFGRPRRIVIDPDNWLLKSTPDLAVRVAVLRGQQAVAQGDLIAAIAEYQKALDENRASALANYRLAEIFMMQKKTTSPPPTASATPSAATATPAGSRSGAISTSAKSSTSPANASAPSTSTASPSKPTTTPRAPSTKPAPSCKNPTKPPPPKANNILRTSQNDLH